MVGGIEMNSPASSSGIGASKMALTSDAMRRTSASACASHRLSSASASASCPAACSACASQTV
eukprot:4858054-Prymnesium_polylepis.1